MSRESYVIHAGNVNGALRQGISMFRDRIPGVREVMARGAAIPGGHAQVPTLEYAGPVSTIYHRPQERVLFDPLRDANPFFHLMECLWIMAGRDDVKWLSHFLKAMARYSDDGETFWGAYGDRLRNGYNDQLTWVIEHLKNDPGSRRAVLTIFNNELDHRDGGKDIPCNCTLMFLARDGILNLTVCNRSNDMVWGAYGANAVQFSFIHEVIAGALGMAMGTYIQHSNSFHVYAEEPTWMRLRDAPLPGAFDVTDPYEGEVHYDAYEQTARKVHHYPIMTGIHGTPAAWQDWDDDNLRFMERTGRAMDNENHPAISNEGFDVPFFNEVAIPMFNVFQQYKFGDIKEALDRVETIRALDWSEACRLWLERRAVARARKG